MATLAPATQTEKCLIATTTALIEPLMGAMTMEMSAATLAQAAQTEKFLRATTAAQPLIGAATRAAALVSRAKRREKTLMAVKPTPLQALMIGGKLTTSAAILAPAAPLTKKLLTATIAALI